MEPENRPKLAIDKVSPEWLERLAELYLYACEYGNVTAENEHGELITISCKREGG